MSTTLDVVYAVNEASGGPVTPADNSSRWSSADMILLDQKVIPSKGNLPDGQELLLAFTAPELTTLAAPAPRLRVGLYPKDRSDLAPGLIEWNQSYRFTAVQICTFNGVEYREEKDFVAAGTTLGIPSALDIQIYLGMLRAFIRYAADSDSIVTTLSTRIAQGILDVPGIGNTYTGSTLP